MAQSTMAADFPIGTLASRTGTKVPTIRYYEQIGLLPAAARTMGQQRRYGAAHQHRLAFIRHARDLGFSLDDVRELLSLSDAPGEPCEGAHVIARVHLAEVRRKIARLRSLEEELERMTKAACDGGTSTTCQVIEVLADHSLCLHDDHDPA